MLESVRSNFINKFTYSDSEVNKEFSYESGQPIVNLASPFELSNKTLGVRSILRWQPSTIHDPTSCNSCNLSQTV